MKKILFYLSFLCFMGCGGENYELSATLGDSDQALKNRVILSSAYIQNNTPLEKRADIYYFDKNEMKVDPKPESNTISKPEDFFKDLGIHIHEKSTTRALVIVYPQAKLYRTTLSAIEEWVLVDGNWKFKDVIMDLPQDWENIINNIK